MNWIKMSVYRWIEYADLNHKDVTWFIDLHSERTFFLHPLTSSRLWPAVRETNPPRYHGRPNWGPSWKPPYIIDHYIALRGSRTAFNWSSIMPRDASLSDSKCDFFFQFEQTIQSQSSLRLNALFFLFLSQIKRRRSDCIQNFPNISEAQTAFIHISKA